MIVWMDLASANLLCGKGTSCIDELNVNFIQIPIQTNTFLKHMIEVKVLKLKIKEFKHFWNMSWNKWL